MSDVDEVPPSKMDGRSNRQYHFYYTCPFPNCLFSKRQISHYKEHLRKAHKGPSPASSDTTPSRTKVTKLHRSKKPYDRPSLKIHPRSKPSLDFTGHSDGDKPLVPRLNEPRAPTQAPLPGDWARQAPLGSAYHLPPETMPHAAPLAPHAGYNAGLSPANDSLVPPGGTQWHPWPPAWIQNQAVPLPMVGRPYDSNSMYPQ